MARRGRRADHPESRAGGTGRFAHRDAGRLGRSGSPAATAGTRTGDVVISVDGTPVTSATGIQRLMVENAIGRRMEVTVWRNGALVDIVVEPEELRVP